MLTPAPFGAPRPQPTVTNLGTFEGHRKQLEAQRRDEPEQGGWQTLFAFAVSLGFVLAAVLG